MALGMIIEVGHHAQMTACLRMTWEFAEPYRLKNSQFSRRGFLFAH
jgi:hypothetical protein